MSTFTDGAPPSVTPGPDDGRGARGRDTDNTGPSDTDDTGAWLRAEIQRRVAEGGSGSGGRHARRGVSRDTVNPPSTAGYVPRHSVAAPGPGSAPPREAGADGSAAPGLPRRERGAPGAPPAAAPWSGPGPWQPDGSPVPRAGATGNGGSAPNGGSIANGGTAWSGPAPAGPQGSPSLRSTPFLARPSDRRAGPVPPSVPGPPQGVPPRVRDLGPAAGRSLPVALGQNPSGEVLFTARTPAPPTRERDAGSTSPPGTVDVPAPRAPELRGVRFPRPAELDADIQGKRVRVVLAERKGVARPVRTVVDIQEGTGVGALLRSNLIGSQLAVAMRFALGAGLTLGLLPLLFAVFPEIGRMEVLGLRLPWLLLGILVYPFLLGLGFWHTRMAERVEQDFADDVQG